MCSEALIFFRLSFSRNCSSCVHDFDSLSFINSRRLHELVPQELPQSVYRNSIIKRYYQSWIRSCGVTTSYRSTIHPPLLQRLPIMRDLSPSKESDKLRFGRRQSKKNCWNYLEFWQDFRATEARNWQSYPLTEWLCLCYFYDKITEIACYLRLAQSDPKVDPVRI